MMTRTAILALSLAFAGAPALAAPAADEGAVIVRIGDLDLATTTGQQRLNQRVKTAAYRLCRSGARNLVERSRELKCVAEVVTSNQPKADRAIAAARGESRLALLMVRTVR